MCYGFEKSYLAIKTEHMTMITPVILSGGSGSRLWPLSRASLPKQFHTLGGSEPMFVETVKRVTGPLFSAPMVVSNHDHRFMVAEALRQAEVEEQAIVLEPCARDTAPALAAAAATLVQQNQNAIMLVLPCDHLIQNIDAFLKAVETGLEAVKDGKLVTFGMKPDKPETGYGYIHMGQELKKSAGSYEVDKFVEKPDLDTAQAYLDSGEFLWNSGMFLMSAQQMLDELKAFEPEMVDLCIQATTSMEHDLTFTLLNKEPFSQAKAVSIDYALWENTDKAACVPVECGWSDIGSWKSLHEVSSSDDNNNVFLGDVIDLNTKNCFVHSDDPDTLVSLAGVKDLAVVATKDVVLVMHQDDSQDVKQLVSMAKEKKRPQALEHSKIHRPWGWYETIDEGYRFKVKHISVKPGGCLSLQKHLHRAEHWVVVSGSAFVTCGEEEKLLTENESIYVSIGEVHRLENRGVIPLHLIEVQTGGYLGEDDIIRLQDVYKRS